MKSTRILVSVATLITGAFLALVFHEAGLQRPVEALASSVANSAPQTQQQSPPTVASVVDRDISAVEKQIIDVAEAMPEEKFNFSPESLNVPGSDYKGCAPSPSSSNTSPLPTGTSGPHSPAKDFPKVSATTETVPPP